MSSSDPFDPIELYAWFLGLNINWRGRGIFLRYYMTFPVNYPKGVKENVLSSFRRGLQRSLPATLLNDPKFQDFSVEELASEPAAYAAIALQELKIPPSAEGVAYGVFDFGGGTADFDFGYYRLPDAQEEDEGYEKVFDHFGTAGDIYLGGENLLENLAYRVFRHNLNVCRVKKIAFTRPMDADDFVGSEMFLEKTRAASTNTVMLIARLRPLWETGKLPNTSGVEKIDLLNKEGTKIPCEFAIPVAELKKYLADRIELGIHNFFAALQKAFAANVPKHIHILLAGNASRSDLVLDLFGVTTNPSTESIDEASLFTRTQEYLKTLFGEQVPVITAYPPLPIDQEHAFKPTGKTGVALGLLRLCPGGVIKVVNHALSNGEAPFAYYLGAIKNDKFHVGLMQGEEYGKWCELGPVRNRVFNLQYSKSPKAHTGEMCEGEPGLKRKRLDLAGNNSGHKLYARAIAPETIEVCTAISLDAVDKHCENMFSIKLD